MPSRYLSVAVGVVALALAAGRASAQQTFEAWLDGVSEVPANASPATGHGTVVLNAAQDQITVDLNWSGMMAAPTASHIHGAADTSHNAAVLFPFTGVPATASGSIPEQTFAINATQVGYLESGQLYFNIHSSMYPGGEIRGQIMPVPEPGSMALVGVGMVALLRRRRS